MFAETGYDVRWKVEKRHKSRGSRLVSTSYRDYERHFITKEQVIKFIKQKKKEWERKDIWNDLEIFDLATGEQFTCRVTWEDDIDAWAEKVKFIQERDEQHV